MIDLKINGTSQTNFILSTPFKDTIDEELDQFNFQIKSTTRLSFNKYDKVEYKITQPLGNSTQTILEKVFALFSCNETWDGEYWLYQITCISPTKILEGIIINGMADTYASPTLMAQLTRVREKINAQLGFEMAIPPQIVFKQTGDNQIDYATFGTYSPSDFLWNGQVNVREIFNDMLDKADHLVIGTDFTAVNGNITQIEIGAVARELKKTRLINTANDIENGGLNDVKELVKGITINRNSEYCCGNIISLIKNGIAKDNVQQTYLPARNTDLTIDDASKWHIITQEPIYSLNNVKALVDISNCIMRVKNPDDSIKYDINGIVLTAYIDITNYIVEKSVFDAMALSEQKKHLYFKRGEKNIYGLYDRYKSGITGLFSNTALENILTDWEHNNIPSNQPLTPLTSVSWFASDKLGHFNASMTQFIPATSDPIIIGDTYFDNYGSMADIIPENFYFNMSTSIAGVIDEKNLLFSVNYQPYCDSVVKIEKSTISDLEANAKNLSMLKNQSDRTIEASKYYDSQQSIINRMGNKEMSLDVIVDLKEEYVKLKSLWDLGDYMTLGSKDWTITQREFENYGDDKLKIRYTLSKYFNASNVDIQINRDKRLYGIPLNNYVDRYILLRNSSVDYSVKKVVIQCWDDFTLPYTDTNTSMGYCLFEAIKIGNDDIVNKVARTMDNYACDIERTKSSSTIVNINLRYCDTDGYKENIQLYALSDTGYNNYVAPRITNYTRLPFIPSSEFQNVINQGYAGSYNLQGIKKDKMERLIFVFREA